MLGLAVLWLNLLAPLTASAHKTAAGPAQATAVVDPVLGPLLICSAPAAIGATASDAPIAPLPSGVGHGLHCPFCAPLLGGGVIAPDAVEPVHYRRQEKLGSPRAQVVALAMQDVHGDNARPRGPPAGRI